MTGRHETRWPYEYRRVILGELPDGAGPDFSLPVEFRGTREFRVNVEAMTATYAETEAAS